MFGVGDTVAARRARRGRRRAGQRERERVEDRLDGRRLEERVPLQAGEDGIEQRRVRVEVVGVGDRDRPRHVGLLERDQRQAGEEPCRAQRGGRVAREEALEPVVGGERVERVRLEERRWCLEQERRRAREPFRPARRDERGFVEDHAVDVAGAQPRHRGSAGRARERGVGAEAYPEEGVQRGLASGQLGVDGAVQVVVEERAHVDRHVGARDDLVGAERRLQGLDAGGVGVVRAGEGRPRLEGLGAGDQRDGDVGGVAERRDLATDPARGLQCREHLRVEAVVEPPRRWRDQRPDPGDLQLLGDRRRAVAAGRHHHCRRDEPRSLDAALARIAQLDLQRVDAGASQGEAVRVACRRGVLEPDRDGDGAGRVGVERRDRDGDDAERGAELAPGGREARRERVPRGEARVGGDGQRVAGQGRARRRPGSGG